MYKESMSRWDVATKSGFEEDTEKFIRQTFLHYPKQSNIEISEFDDVPISLVKKLRKEVQQK